MKDITPEQILNEYRLAVLSLEDAVAVNSSNFESINVRVEVAAKPILEALKAFYRSAEKPHGTTDLWELSKRMREVMKENEGWTFFLPDFPPLGKKRIDKCGYCWEPKVKHREDGRCPIKGCTLGGPPKEGKI